MGGQYVDIVRMWRLLEFCGYIGLAIFFFGTVITFWKMKIPKSFEYFYKGFYKRFQKRINGQRTSKIIRIMVLFCMSSCCVTSVISVCALEKTEQEQIENIGETSIEITPVENGNRVKDITYYNRGINGRVRINKEWRKNGEITLLAIPLDDVAKRTAEKADNSRYCYENNYCKILDWSVEESTKESEEKEPETIIEIVFQFQLQGRWKVELCCYMSDKPEDTVYKIVSEDFIIDQVGPQLTVIYENCKNISSSCSSPDQVNRLIQRMLPKINSSDCEIYASGKGKIVLKIKEDYFSSEAVKLKVVKESYENGRKKDVTKQWKRFERNEGRWEKEGESFVLEYEWEKEGHYRFYVEYEDFAGNMATAKKNSETMACLDEGKYEGPSYTLDNTAPLLKNFVYQRVPEKIWGTRSYFIEYPVMRIEIEEENFNCGDFHLKDILTKADGNMMCPAYDENAYSITWTSRYVEGKRINVGDIKITKEANHTVSGWVIDGCGQRSGICREECTYDTTPPEVEVRVWGEDSFIPYKTYQYFGKERFMAAMMARDDISGVQRISCFFKEEEGHRGKQELEQNYGEENVIVFENKRTDVQQEDLSEYTETIVIDQQDFKGRIYVHAESFAGKQSREVSSPGLLLASKTMHKKSSNIFFDISEADYTDKVNKIKYYRNSVTVTAKGEDVHAGIGEFVIYAGRWDKKTQINEKKVSVRKRADAKNKEDISYEESLMIDIGPKEFQESNAENPVEIEAVLTDNAGNTLKKKYEEYRLVTDSIKPEIQVAYNTNSATNGKYYNCTRTATVTVRDKNFNPDSVQWEITGSNQKYHIGKWKREGEIHQCEVRFEGDGKNYRLKLAVQDYAGNQSVWNEDTAFTIDKTPPVIHMNIDVANAENGKYYCKPQNILFYVKDKNIDMENAAVCMVMKENNVQIKGEKKSTRYKSKKEKVLILQQAGKNSYAVSELYEKEGEYHLQFWCTDLAGNRTESEKTLQFVIDYTPPDIRVDGVEDQMAYAGNICPFVEVTDRNLDRKSVYARLEKIDSSQKPVELLALVESVRDLIPGRRYVWKNDSFPFREEMDGIYRLQVYARDLAGNQKTLEKGVVFCINRFGSVYVMQDRLKNILKKGYMREKEGIVITEYNVNPVDTRITILKDNQKWRELYIDGAGQKETKDGKYAVLVKKVSSGSKKGWYVKRHYLSEKNFVKEGTYQITLESSSYIVEKGEKKIIKETSSTLKEQPIYFTVDRTPPVVQIGGLEKNYYEAKKHPFVITVMDNCEFAYMDLTIRYEKGEKKQQTIRITPEHLKSNHSVVRELSAYEGRQIISYQAWDTAGNCLDAEENGEEISCVVMDTAMIQNWEKNLDKIEKITENSETSQHNFLFLAGLAGIMITLAITGSAVYWIIVYKKISRK